MTAHPWERVGLGHLRCPRCGVERVVIPLPLAAAVTYVRAGVDLGPEYPRCEDPATRPSVTSNYG